jgi:LysM repeat protein
LRHRGKKRLKIKGNLPLELEERGFYVRRMKRISFFLVAALLAAPGVSSRAQDAAVEERLDKLSARIDDLVATQELHRKQIEALEKQLNELQEQQSKPVASYATQDDLKRLAEKVQENLKEVDEKRVKDNELIAQKLEKLAKTLTASPPKKTSLAPPPVTTPTTGVGGQPTSPEKGFDYVVKSGDSLSAIAKAYSAELKAKVTVKQILDANPGLKPEKMKEGQKIFIPAPPQ